MTHPLLSIIIPTKDRYPCLVECLRTLSQLPSADVEIVISDNSSDTSDFPAFLSSFDGPPVKYVHHAVTLSQAQNSEAAAALSSGDYVCFIGDDDSVSRCLVDVVRAMKESGVEACICNMSTYYWPDVQFRGRPKPALSFSTSTPRVSTLDAVAELRRSLRWGAQDIQFLPRAYHAVVSRQVMETVRATTGSFFPGESPDMSNAAACASTAPRCLYVGLPLIVSGASFNSGAGMGQRHESVRDATRLYHFPEDTEQGWPTRVPHVGWGYSLWANATLRALRSMGRADLERDMNYSALYAKQILKYPQITRDVLTYVHGLPDYARLGSALVLYASRAVGARVLRTANRLAGRTFVERSAVTLAQATTLTDAHNRRFCSDVTDRIRRFAFAENPGPTPRIGPLPRT